MKRLIAFCLTGLIAVSVQAQTLTEKYLKMIPPLPKDSCNITRASIDIFVNQVYELSELLDSAIDSLENMADNQMENSEETAKANAMKQMSQQYGLSPEQMQKMQSGNMSEADKQALANQVLFQQTNMSMGDLQNLSKMSDAGKEAYVEAYAMEAQATVQANPEKYKVNESAKSMNELIASQQAVLGKINSNTQKVGDLYAAIDGDPAIQQSDKKISEWHNKLMSMTGVDYGQGKQMDSLAMLIRSEQISICDKYTPKYRTALRHHFTDLKASMPDQEELGRITSDLSKMQTGVALPSESVEAGKLQSIKGYLSKLKVAYKFKLYFPEDN
jgi:hypothetical protein